MPTSCACVWFDANTVSHLCPYSTRDELAESDGEPGDDDEFH